jgi:hypothetical protein
MRPLLAWVVTGATLSACSSYLHGFKALAVIFLLLLPLLLFVKPGTADTSGGEAALPRGSSVTPVPPRR